MEFKLATFDIDLTQLGFKSEASIKPESLIDDSSYSSVNDYDILSAIELKSKRNGEKLAKEWSNRRLSLPTIIDEAFRDFVELKSKLHAFCQHFDAKKAIMKSDIEMMLNEKIPHALKRSTESMEEIKVSMDSIIDNSINESLEDFNVEGTYDRKRDSFDSYYSSNEDLEYNKKMKQTFELSFDKDDYKTFSHLKPFSSHST